STFTPNLGDAWTYTMDAVSRYFDRVLEAPTRNKAELIGGVYPGRAKQLGQRTGELHLALAEDEPGGLFAPEPFTVYHQRGLYQAMRGSTGRMLRELHRTLDELAAEEAALAREVMTRAARILQPVAPLLPRPIRGQ